MHRVLLTVLACLATASPATAEPPELPRHGKDVQLRGWTPDGSRYAVEVYRGYNMGALGGVDYLALREVRDVATSKLVETYKKSRGTDGDGTRAWTKAHDAARAKDEWVPFLKTLAPGRRGLKAKTGGWQIGAEQGGKPSEGVRLTFKPDKTKIALHLDVAVGEEEDTGEAVKRRASVRIVGRKGKDELTLGRVALPHGFFEDPCGGAGQTTADGGIAARWQPGDKHVFIQLWLTQETTNDECPGHTYSTYWVLPYPFGAADAKAP